MGEPDVAADHAPGPDDGVATQDRGVGVDHDIVLDRGVPLLAGQVLPHAQRAEGHALVEPHPRADLAGEPNPARSAISRTLARNTSPS